MPQEINLSKDERILRELLWIRHGCSVGQLYGDDGECQCGKCMIDFLRDSPADIQKKFEAAARKEFDETFKDTYCNHCSNGPEKCNECNHFKEK